MRWLPLTGLILLASCSSVWSNCGQLDAPPVCDMLVKNSCGSNATCTAMGVCEPVPDGGTCPSPGLPPEAPQRCSGGFCWENPTSLGQTLNAVWGIDANNIWAVGNMGTIVRWDSTSQRWSLSVDSMQSDFYGVWGSSATDVWMVGPSGTIRHWDGCGFTSPMNNPATAAGGSLNAIWGFDQSHVWAVGQGGAIYYYDGSSWTTQTSNTPYDLHAIYGTSASDVWAVGNSGTVLRYNGSAWKVGPSVTGNPIVRGVWVDSSLSTVWVTTDDGRLLQMGENLAAPSWSLVLNAGVELHGISGFPGGPGGPNVWYAQDDGAVNMHEPKGPFVGSYAVGYPMLGVFSIDAAHAYVVGSSGAIWGCTNVNNSCYSVPGGAAGNLNGVWSASPQVAWAAGDGGTFLQRDPSTRLWRNLQAGNAMSNYTSISGYAPAGAPDAVAAWAVGTMASSVKLTPAGPSNIQTLNSATYFVTFTDPMGTAWAVDNSSQALASTNANQTSWGPSNIMTVPMRATAIWADGLGTIYIGNDTGQLWRSNAMAPFTLIGTASSMMGTTPSISAIWGPDASNLWTVGGGGSLTHWAPVAGSLTPSPDVQGVPASVPRLRGVWGKDPSSIWAVGDQGTVLHQSSGQWQTVMPGASADLAAVYGAGTIMWVVGVNGTILSYNGP